MTDQRLINADPRDLNGLRAALKGNDPEGRLCPILMERIYIQEKAIECLPEVVEGYTKNKKVLMVTDMTPYYRGKNSLKEVIYYLLSPLFTVTWLALDNHDHVLSESGADCVVGIGGGTVADLCKDATFAVKNQPPLIIVQTALSVNAFSDGISIMLKNGVKTSLPTRYPTVLIIDLEVIERAPAERNLAGYGDVLATWTAPVDWYLAWRLGMNTTYNEDSAHTEFQAFRLLGSTCRAGEGGFRAFGKGADVKRAVHGHCRRILPVLGHGAYYYPSSGYGSGKAKPRCCLPRGTGVDWDNLYRDRLGDFPGGI